TMERARDMYGVVLRPDGSADETATISLREQIRGTRRQRPTSPWISEDRCEHPQHARGKPWRVGESVELEPGGSGALRCRRCGEMLSGPHGRAAIVQRPLRAAGPWMALRHGGDGPTVMEVVPYDFYRFAPDGVGLVGVTCNIDDWSDEFFDKALAQVTTAAAYLGSRGVHFIIHGGGPLVVARGKGFEDIVVNDIEAAAKVPATTGVRAAMEALRHIGARRRARASPYAERHSAARPTYVAGHAFEV